MARTAPISNKGLESTGKNRIREVLVRTESGEKPVGPKTVYMMIQDALGKARDTDAGVMQRGTIFVREMVSDTIHNATRSLRIGLALLAAALLVVSAALVYGLVSTKQSVAEGRVAAQKSASDVKGELSGELQGLKVERDKAAVESATLTKRLDEVAKSADGGQKAVQDLKARLKDAEQKRHALETKMGQAMAALEADRAALAAEKTRIQQEEKARAEAEERRRADEAQKAKDEADRKAQEEARRAAEAQAQPATASTPPQTK